MLLLWRLAYISQKLTDWRQSEVERRVECASGLTVMRTSKITVNRHISSSERKETDSPGDQGNITGKQD